MAWTETRQPVRCPSGFAGLTDVSTLSVTSELQFPYAAEARSVLENLLVVAALLARLGERAAHAWDEVED